jgi:hypothetical protein
MSSGEMMRSRGCKERYRFFIIANSGAMKKSDIALATGKKEGG